MYVNRHIFATKSSGSMCIQRGQQKPLSSAADGVLEIPLSNLYLHLLDRTAIIGASGSGNRIPDSFTDSAIHRYTTTIGSYGHGIHQLNRIPSSRTLFGSWFIYSSGYHLKIMKECHIILLKPKQEIPLKASNCLQLLCSDICSCYCCTVLHTAGNASAHCYTVVCSVAAIFLPLLSTINICCFFAVLLLLFCFPLFSAYVQVTHNTTTLPPFSPTWPRSPLTLPHHLLQLSDACHANCETPDNIWPSRCCLLHKREHFCVLLSANYFFSSPASRQYRESRQWQRC